MGSAAFTAFVVVASAHPGPRGWGLHAPGFLPLPLRLGLLLMLAGCAAIVALGAFRPGRRDEGEETRARPRGVAFWLPGLLLPYGAALWALRARTQLLGDGTVWLATARTGEHRAYSEPLFAALWHAFAALVRRTGRTPDGLSMSLFPVLCGVAAALILAGIATEIAPARRRWLLPLALLLTLGVSQLFFGYIESYPAAAVFILLYLWLALRRARGLDPWWVAAAALALAVAAHLSALYLVPSYVVLLWLEKGPLGRRAMLLALPFAILAALLVALGYRPSEWTAPLRAAASGVREGMGASFHRPYGFFSFAHFADVANAVLLAMPVPVLLLFGWGSAMRGRLRPFPKDLAVLAAAAVPGFLLLAWVMTPVAPAQDWDLASIFLLPAAVLGIAAGRWLWADRSRTGTSLALVGIAAISLLSFVLVNASEQASVRRFGALMDDPGRVSPYGRSYGASVLELYFRDRGQYAEALAHARAAVAAEPTNPRNWTNVGYELMAMERHAEAIPYFREGIRRGPDRWEGRYNLGLSYMRLGRYEEAVPPLREAVALQGNLPVLRHNLGLALYRSGHADSALVVWRYILLRWPEYGASLQPTKERPAP